MRRQRLLLGVAVTALVGALVPAATVTAQPAGPRTADDTIDVGTSIEDRMLAQASAAEAERLRAMQSNAHRTNAAADARARGADGGFKADLPTSDLPPSNPGPTPEKDATEHELVGMTKEWLGLDDTEQTPGNFFGYYPKEYRLAAVGDHIEIWVAVGGNASYDPSTGIYTLPFDQADDCRNTIAYDGQTRVEVTPEQLSQLVADFDQNMYPLETDAFFTPPARNGEDPLYNSPGYFGTVFPQKPDGYFATPGGGDRTVALIDNVRDAAYYTPPDEEQLSYIAGFFSSVFNAAFDRNVMTVDAYDWLHRTGANPPDHASDDPCAGAAARPFLYEGTFAHEWQHLLQSYVGGETTWVNEGLSDWAQTLTGYVDPTLQIDEPEYDSHIQCFTGFLAEQTPYNLLPRETSGPENSLTWWQDQGQGEILCDYGAAYTFMEYTAGQFGTAAMSYLFGDPAAGLSSVANLLAAAGDERSAQDYLHDWAAMVALDGALDANGGRLRGGDAGRYATPTLESAINWDENDAYDTPGAPPNGSDYVRLRDASGSYVAGNRLRDVTFSGAAILDQDLEPTAWSSIADPFGSGDAVLYSGSGNNLDNTMALEVTVPDADPTLTFETLFQIEWAWDYGFVQVSTDGGQSWTSLADELTSASPDPQADTRITDQLPGISGNSWTNPDGVDTYDPTNAEGPEWIDAEFDLSDYAGQDVLVGFRYMTDAAVAPFGWAVDDVAVGGELLLDGTSTDGLRSYEEVYPPRVENWHVTLVGYRSTGGAPAAVLSTDVVPGETLQLSRRDLRNFRSLDVVAAIVTFDEPTESLLTYAPYELSVNGVLQPGGS